MFNFKRTILAAICMSTMLCGCGKTVPAASVTDPAATTELTEEASDNQPTSSTQTVTAADEEETTASEEVTTEPEETVVSDPVAEKLAELTLQQKVCQMFIVTPEQLTGYGTVTQSDWAMQQGLNNYSVGGMIFFANNLVWQEQTRNMLAGAQSYAKESCGIGLFTAIDEEGGTVARAAQKLGTTSFSNMSYYGSLNDSQTAYNVGETIGRDLSGLGFNLDFAPVADVNLNSGNELGSRIFSSDPTIVSDMVANVVLGLQSQGVCATLKHFPGLGAADGNTHYDNSVLIYRTLDELRSAEFIPFKGGIDAGADFVMVGHQIVTGIGDNTPADLSYTAVTELLRGELGFEGIAVTDAQQMNTIAGVYGSGDAAVRSVQAGIDIILMPADLPSAVYAVCSAVENGQIAEERIDESVTRILTKKYELGLIDIPADNKEE